MFRRHLIAFVLVLVQVLPAVAQQPDSAVRSGRASSPRVTAAGQSSVILPGTQAAAFGDIEGKAVDSNNRPLPRRTVRLRDVRNGRMVETRMTDDVGAFLFRRVDPGNYVVELVDDGQRALAASDLVTINAGQSTATIVRLPATLRTASGWLTTAAIVAGSAAAAGVLAIKADSCVSPPCGN